MLRIEIPNWTPTRTKDVEILVATYAKAAVQKSDWNPELAQSFGVDLNISFCFPIPKSVKKDDRRFMVSAPHTRKPDIDNLLKLIKDALNGIAWLDDSCVARVYASKCYDYEPSCSIEISLYEL
jgi:Holliday junction resolvase RusA-like endonuclease